MIDIVFRTKVAPSQLPEPKSLRNFLYDALDINYVQTDKSRALLNPDENIKLYFARQVWHDCRALDLGTHFKTKLPNKPHVLSRSNLRLCNQLDEYVGSKRKIPRA